MRIHPLISRPTLGLLISLSSFFQRAHTQGLGGCGNKGATRTISQSSEASALKSCTVFTGSIAIATSYSGGLAINGVQEILENLTVQNVTGITSLEMDDLRHIDGNFTMSNVILISSLSLGSLTSVGAINWFSLPSIDAFNFTVGISSVASVVITNTFLSSLDGFNLKNADSVQIINNVRMISVKLPLYSVKDSLQIGANAQVLDVALPELTSAGSLRLENISTLSLPKLSFISGNLGLQGSFVESLSLDTLSVIQQNLSIRENAKLKGVSFQNLLAATLVDIRNNPALTSLSFATLARADSVIIEGNYTEYTLHSNTFDSFANWPSLTIPGLTSVNNTFQLRTTDANFDCIPFDKDRDQGILKGSYTCQGKHATPTATPTKSSGDDKGIVVSAVFSGKKIIGVVVGAIAAIAAIIGAVTGIFKMKRKKKNGEGGTTDTDGKAGTEADEMKTKELPTGREVHEAPENHGISEAGGNRRGGMFELPAESVLPRRGGKNLVIPRKPVQ